MTKPLKPMRLLVAGDEPRSGELHTRVVKTLNMIAAGGKRPVTVIHSGDCGAGASAGLWASATHTPYEVYPNEPERCFTDGRPHVLVVFGASAMVDLAAAANVKVVTA